MNTGGGPKENANPTLHVVETKSLLQQQTNVSLLLPGLSASSLNTTTTTTTTTTTPRSVTDRAVLQALTDASIASHGKGVSLLKKVGCNIPKDAQEQKEQALLEQQRHGTIQFKNTKTKSKSKSKSQTLRDEITPDEIFEVIRNIQDPEHPHTLEQLGVVSRQQITVTPASTDDDLSTLEIRFTPTIPHCSMATLIGLCIRVKLLRSLPPNQFKVSLKIEPGTHQTEDAVNKQLDDKERVCAALENAHLRGVVNKCISQGMHAAGCTDPTHHH